MRLARIVSEAGTLMDSKTNVATAVGCQVEQHTQDRVVGPSLLCPCTSFVSTKKLAIGECLCVFCIAVGRVCGMEYVVDKAFLSHLPDTIGQAGY